MISLSVSQSLNADFVVLLVLLRKLPQEHSYIILHIYYTILVAIELMSERVYGWIFPVLLLFVLSFLIFYFFFFFIIEHTSGLDLLSTVTKEN